MFNLSVISLKFTNEKLKYGIKRVSGSDDVVIRSIESGNNVEKKGDSYLSSIYRFLVIATTKTNTREDDISLHVIAKGFPKNIARRKTFRSVDFFNTEINFYNNVWPLMKQLKDSSNINEPDEVPMVLSSLSDGENDYIALKDLSFDGYRTIQRDMGISQECASVFLKLLANFHALSIAANYHNPGFEKIARSLNETYFDEKYRSWYSGFMEKKLFELVRNAVRTQLEPIYLENINKLFASDFYGRICRLAKGPPSKLLAVTHGDVWLPNILVSGTPIKDAILIDFQLARYSSVTGDLVHFLYSCVDYEVLLNYWDDLVQVYYNHLSKRNEELNCNGNLFTIDDLRQDIQKNFHIGFAMAMESTVMSLLTDEDVPDLDEIQGNEAVPLEAVWDISPFDDDSRNKKVAYIIKHAVDKGFI